MTVTQTNPEPHIRLRTDRRDNGWVEIGVYVESAIASMYPIHIVSVSRPSRSAKWRIGSRMFRDKADAMDMAMTIARNSLTYRTTLDWEAR